jgi:hypothetical protein
MEHGVEDGGLKTEIRDQTSEVRGKKASGVGRGADVRGRRSVRKKEDMAIALNNCTGDVDMGHGIIAYFVGRKIHFDLMTWCRLIA